jgi:hypothetical protein
MKEEEDVTQWLSGGKRFFLTFCTEKEVESGGSFENTERLWKKWQQISTH